MMLDLDCEDSALLRDCKDAIKYGYRFETVSLRFEICELHVYNIHSMELSTYPFMLSLKWSELNDYDRRVRHYVYHHVHGIRFDAKNGYLQSNAKNIIASIFSDCIHESYIVCYKGGDYLRVMLGELNMYRYDLNFSDCPKKLGVKEMGEWIDIHL